MRFKDSVSFDEIKGLVISTLTEFYTKDAILLDYNTENGAVAERCIVFHIGWYMLEKMRSIPELQWANLDCEYNRNFDDPKGIYRRSAGGEKEKIKDVIPDLIIHQRRNNENNLLVVEFKKGKPSDEGKENDEEKLKYFTDIAGEYGYSMGFYIELHRDRVNIEVYQQGERKRELDYILWVKKDC